MKRQITLNRLLVAGSAAGFVFLLADTTIEHRDLFFREFWVLIPALFGIAGAVAGAVAYFRWDEKAIRFFNIVLIASCVVAAAGIYFHIGEDDDEDARPVAAQMEQKKEKEKEKDKPILAPLSFAGVAVVGLLGTLRKWEAEVRPTAS
ncbi:MAG TPA: hypothetical protein VMW43_03080 [Bacteroidota bacterium]|nr:hypothetical protein [Bacteroidota bacterium]